MSYQENAPIKDHLRDSVCCDVLNIYDVKTVYDYGTIHPSNNHWNEGAKAIVTLLVIWFAHRLLELSVSKLVGS